MPVENGVKVPGHWVGITLTVMTILISLNVGFTAWLSVRWIETETTQNSVTSDIQTLKDATVELKGLLSDIHQKISLLPMAIDDDDRWYRDLEIEYQKSQRIRDDSQDMRINELKLFHPPHK